MSAKSDQFEKDVAKSIDTIAGIKASRPSVGTEYPDVLLEYNKKKTWLEVKMNHTDNLSNPRVFYKNGIWSTTYKTPAAKEAVKKAILSLNEDNNIPLNLIEIMNTKEGAPIVKIINNSIVMENLQVSISHTDEFATATAILEIK